MQKAYRTSILVLYGGGGGQGTLVFVRGVPTILARGTFILARDTPILSGCWYPILAMGIPVLSGCASIDVYTQVPFLPCNGTEP